MADLRQSSRSIRTARSTTSIPMTIGRTLKTQMSRYMVENEIDKDPELVHVLSFDDPTLLRAMDVNRLLRAHASILKSSSGNGETYLESHETLCIHAFLSHNWSTPRWQKFLMVAIHFNSTKAVMTTMIFTVLVTSLAIANCLPKFEILIDTSSSQRFEMSIGNTLCLGPVLVASLLSVHEIMWRLGIRGPGVFLDKTCIHQSNETRKIKGIRGLGASILHSRRFIVLYADTYFKKLWTVYELAAFVALRSSDKMTFVPTILPQMILAGIITNYIWVLVILFINMKFIGSQNQNLSMWLTNSTLVLSFIALGLFSVRCSRAQRGMLASLATFDIRCAACYVEDDRAFVEDNVAKLVRVAGIVGPEASKDEALAAFNIYIRTSLPQLLDRCLGHAGVLYHHLVLMNLPILALGLDYSCFAINYGLPLLDVISDAMLLLVILFGELPLFMRLFSQAIMCVSSNCRVWTTGVAIAVVMILAAALFHAERYILSAVSKPVRLLMQFLYTASIILLTWFVFYPRKKDACLGFHEAYSSNSHGCGATYEGGVWSCVMSSNFSRQSDILWDVASETAIEPPHEVDIRCMSPSCREAYLN